MTLYRTIVADPPWELQAGPGFAPNGPSRDLTYPTMSVEQIAALPVRDLSTNVDQDAHLYLWTVNAYLREAFDIARAWGFHPVQTIVWAKRTIGTGLGGAWPSNVEFVLFCRRPRVTRRPDVLAVTAELADAAAAAGLSRRQIDAHMGTVAMAGWWVSRLEHRCAVPTDEQWPRLRAFLGLPDSSPLNESIAALNASTTSGDRRLQRAPSSWFSWPRGEHSAKPEGFLDLVEQVSPGPYLELFSRRARLGWDTWGDQALGGLELLSEGQEARA